MTQVQGHNRLLNIYLEEGQELEAFQQVAGCRSVDQQLQWKHNYYYCDIQAIIILFIKLYAGGTKADEQTPTVEPL